MFSPKNVKGDVPATIAGLVAALATWVLSGQIEEFGVVLPDVARVVASGVLVVVGSLFGRNK